MGVRYLVASPGRSGSIFVTVTIAKSLQLTPVFSWPQENTNDHTPLVLHSHNAKLQLPDDNIVVVQPYRRNLFKELVSAVIGETYNEWSDESYSGQGAPFVCDINLFRTKYAWHKKWRQAFEYYTSYTNRVYLCFEDFIGNSLAVCESLGIPKVYHTSKKSPYSENTILNIDQLRLEFEKLEQDQELQNESVEKISWVSQKKI